MISLASGADSILYLSGTIEHFEAAQCKQSLSLHLSEINEDNLHIDISGLQSVSSVTLAFLLFGLREAKLSSRQLYYKNMPPALFNMARVSGIESILITD